MTTTTCPAWRVRHTHAEIYDVLNPAGELIARVVGREHAERMAASEALLSAVVMAEHVVGHTLNPQEGRPEEGSTGQLTLLLDILRAALARATATEES